jgi:hypothetical protein
MGDSRANVRTRSPTGSGKALMTTQFAPANMDLDAAAVELCAPAVSRNDNVAAIYVPSDDEDVWVNRPGGFRGIARTLRGSHGSRCISRIVVPTRGHSIHQPAPIVTPSRRLLSSAPRAPCTSTVHAADASGASRSPPTHRPIRATRIPDLSRSGPFLQQLRETLSGSSAARQDEGEARPR